MTDIEQRARTRIEAVAATPGIEPDRLAQEIAILASRADVREEVVRLAGHIREFEAAVADGSPVGKRLDFICQEMNREITTLGNKVQSGDISRLVVEAKACVEKIREQVQNVE
ncbi:MAG: DUF1732 domain-containing protein [Deltaproteobacteria bacterium]|nr:DUF1732 domain-containing protein [Deltaproteobacteria bacterium]